jgi:hypothetical protein
VSGRELMRYGICSHFVPSEKIASLKEDLIKNIGRETTSEGIDFIIREYSEEHLIRELPENYEVIRAIFKDDSI